MAHPIGSRLSVPIGVSTPSTGLRNRWEPTANEAEPAALAEILNTCTPTRTLTVVQSDMHQPAATHSTTPTMMESYDSCDSANAAGEPQVLGSKGPGRGYPNDKLSSARDGDGIV